MQYHAIQCNTMQYHAIPCIINNCWRSVPLPCGHYNGHFWFLRIKKNIREQNKFECIFYNWQAWWYTATPLTLNPRALQFNKRHVTSFASKWHLLNIQMSDACGNLEWRGAKLWLNGRIFQPLCEFWGNSSTRPICPFLQSFFPTTKSLVSGEEEVARPIWELCTVFATVVYICTQRCTVHEYIALPRHLWLLRQNKHSVRICALNIKLYAVRIDFICRV